MVHPPIAKEQRISLGVTMPGASANQSFIPLSDPENEKPSPQFGGQTFDLRRKSLEKENTNLEKNRASSFMLSGSGPNLGKTFDTTQIVQD